MKKNLIFGLGIVVFCANANAGTFDKEYSPGQAQVAPTVPSSNTAIQTTPDIMSYGTAIDGGNRAATTQYAPVVINNNTNPINPIQPDMQQFANMPAPTLGGQNSGTSGSGTSDGSGAAEQGPPSSLKSSATNNTPSGSQASNKNGGTTETCTTDTKGNKTCKTTKNQDTDHCSDSAYWAQQSEAKRKDYGSICNDAFNSKDTAVMVAGIAQVGGAALTSAGGQLASQQAMSTGTQASAYSGAATTTTIAGMSQMAAAAANMTMGVLQWKAANAAKQGAVDAQADSKVQQSAATASGSSVAANKKQQADLAVKEQNEAASAAKMGAIGSIATGAIQTLTGGVSLAAAAQMRKAAAELANAQTAPTLAIPGDPFSNTAAAPAMGNTITGSGIDTSAAAATPNAVPSSDLSSLVGQPTGTSLGNNLVAAAPSPGVFTPGAPQSGGGGGGGSLGGSATSDAKGDPEQQAKMATSDKVNYDGGSSSFSGGAAKGLGSGGDKGPDLSSMLASLLPKQEEAPGPQNGILSYGNRSPASEGQYSYYDSGTNIFEHVSSRYQDKTKQLHL